MRKEFEIFEGFIKTKGLRSTPQRQKILEVFLLIERHVSCEQLYRLVKRKDPSIGYTTVYRTMKLLSKLGLCGKEDFGDRVLRFEHKYGHRHHDHLICTECGRYIEVINPEIEKMQETMAKKHNFMPTAHKLEIFGVCKRCLSGGNKQAGKMSCAQA